MSKPPLYKFSFYIAFFCIAPILIAPMLAIAHADRGYDLLDLDLPALQKLSITTGHGHAPGRSTLAFLNSEIISRSGAKNLQELLKLYVPEQTLLNKKPYVLEINGHALSAQHNAQLTIDNIKKVEFICDEHSAAALKNIVAVTTFK